MEQKKRVKFVNKDKTQFLKTLKQRVDNYFSEKFTNEKSSLSGLCHAIYFLYE